MKKLLAGVLVIGLVSSLGLSRASYAGPKRKLTTQRNGGREGGNGGGGLLINGKHYTFGELGVSVVDSSQPEYEVPDGVQDELKSLLDPKRTYLGKLKWLDLWNTVNGPDAKYQVVKVVDPSKFRAMKREYEKAISASSEVFKQGQFSLYAITGPNEDLSAVVTSLFPDFFLLDAHAQALILFHEGLLRWYDLKCKSLEKTDTELLASVIRAEGALESLYKSDLQSADPTDLFMALKETGFFTINQEIGYFLKYLGKSHQFQLSVRDIGGMLYSRVRHWTSSGKLPDGKWASYSGNDFTQQVVMDPFKLRQLDRVHPRFSKIFKNLYFSDSSSIDSDYFKPGHPESLSNHPECWIFRGFNMNPVPDAEEVTDTYLFKKGCPDGFGAAANSGWHVGSFNPLTSESELEGAREVIP